MSEATPQELKNSINELTAYRDRLAKEVITVSQKLKIPQKKIDSTLQEHSELKQVNELLNQLIAALGKQKKGIPNKDPN